MITPLTLLSHLMKLMTSFPSDEVDDQPRDVGLLRRNGQPTAREAGS